MENIKWKMENGMNDQTSDESSLAPSRLCLRAHRAGAFHIRHQTDRAFRDRVEFARDRRGLSADPGRLIDSIFVAQPGMVALHESGRAPGRVLDVVASEAGGR